MSSFLRNLSWCIQTELETWDNENAVLEGAGLGIFGQGRAGHAIPQLPDGDHAGVGTGPEFIQGMGENITNGGQCTLFDGDTLNKNFYLLVSFYGGDVKGKGGVSNLFFP